VLSGSHEHRYSKFPKKPIPGNKNSWATLSGAFQITYFMPESAKLAITCFYMQHVYWQKTYRNG